MVRSCSTNAARPDTQGCLEMGTTGKEKALQTPNNVEKDCRDGTEGIRIDMGAGATFSEEQDPLPVEERHRCGPPHAPAGGLRD